MSGPPLQNPPDEDICNDADYSSPENLAALPFVIDLVLDVRREVNESHRDLARKVQIYERSLGLLVLPVLLRRAAIVLARRLRRGRAPAQ